MRPTSNVRIKNKKATFLYEILETYTAGIELTGTEIKSIRNNKAGLNETYCTFINSGHSTVTVSDKKTKQC